MLLTMLLLSLMLFLWFQFDLLSHIFRFLESAGSVLNYFESFLGRIEIKTADKVREAAKGEGGSFRFVSKKK